MKQSIVMLSIYFATNMNMFCQNMAWDTPNAGNPILPGYFADPTIRKFGDTYYIYTTTDGTGNGYGPPQVWVSKDFSHWRNFLMNWPTTEVVWAPDVVKAADEMYRYYYCTPCQVYVGESTSPIGPWHNRLGKADAVLVPDRFVHNAITLDPMLFQDDDGSEYLYFGTWGIYKGFGCGVAKLSDDGKSFTDKKLIENTEIADFFEAPFIFKKNNKYYFTYSSGSCHDDTYRVQYAVSNDGPMGPYAYKGCILKTNSDGTVHGPGHHSILVDGDDYYIIYHRHNIPQSIHGFNRQICIDKMEFDENGNIIPIVPTHSGVTLNSITNKKTLAPNIASGAKATASSYYSDYFKPEYATDDNNATLWKANKCNGDEWIQIDLGEIKEFNQIWTQFEYVTFFYQYKIETSCDGLEWSIYSDKTKNVYQGSPMIDTGHMNARYIRITVTDTQKNGHFPAIWNIQVYNSTDENDPRQSFPDFKIDETALLSGYPWIHTKDVDNSERAFTNYLNHKLVDIDASDYKLGEVIKEIRNKGINGYFNSAEGIPVVPKSGKVAFRFDGKTTAISNFTLPNTMKYNAPYTINSWILNPEPGSTDCIAQFSPSGNDLATIELRNGTNRSEGIIAHNASFENFGAPQSIKANEWQFWSIVYDGYMERIFCNGQEVASKNSFLMIRPEGNIILGNSFRGGQSFNGYLHSLEFFDIAMSQSEIIDAYNRPSSYSKEMENEFSKFSKIKEHNYIFDIHPISPNQAIVSIKSDDNFNSDNGLYNYLFGFNKNELLPSSTKNKIININKKSKVIYGQVKDVFGGQSKVIKGKINISSKDFEELSKSLTIPLDSDGNLKLESENSYLEYDASRCGPISTVEIDGDFLIECKVTDMTGMQNHNTPAYNEGGVIIIDEQGNNRHNLIHLGVFPNYNCGNMLTVVSRRGRPQYKNDKGWDFDPYLQLERRGNKVYARTSKDGQTWEDMPNSPVDLNVPIDKKLRTGIYQTTYTDNHAYVSFSDIKIWKRK